MNEQEMTDYMVIIVETDGLEDLLDCCKIAAVGDGIEVRRTVDPAERPS